jgi:hypothetical protein
VTVRPLAGQVHAGTDVLQLEPRRDRSAGVRLERLEERDVGEVVCGRGRHVPHPNGGVAEVTASSPLWAGAILGIVNEDDLRRLKEVGSMTAFAGGRMVIEYGKPGTGLFVLLEGTLVVEAPEATRELGPGSVFGERALLSEHGLRTARVRALTDGVLLAVDRVDVDRLCAEDPAFAERLAGLY